MIEDIVLHTFPDWVVRLSRSMVGSGASVWTWLSLFIGVALVFIAYVRLLAS